ncbi:hypothetical protein ILYODFUR_033790 [Ilyodon furcidens]|uniref:Uncharacterized protein n=1 Tax=Ilyodon furcidens TaxID=33524 RepID=A0ABV0UEM2_9TELE
MNQNQPHTNRGEDSQPLQSLLMKKAPQILQEYETSGFLSMHSTKLLVKTCVGDLVVWFLSSEWRQAGLSKEHHCHLPISEGPGGWTRGGIY